jgi:anti-sigma-K factor RskA
MPTASPDSDFIKLVVSNMLPPNDNATTTQRPPQSVQRQRHRWRLVGAFSVLAFVVTTVECLLPPQPPLVAVLLGLGNAAAILLSYFLYREDFGPP